MRALIQRVREAQVTVEGHVVGTTGPGLLVLLGVGPGDTEAQVEKLWAKISKLRIFSDEAGHMNRSVVDVGGSALIVSQFTLYADCRKGNRPSFTSAAKPDLAEALYERFCDRAARDVPVGRGVFGADMQVALVNDGPVTIWLDTDEFGK